MKNLNNSGFSLLIGMGLVIILTLSAYFILSFIIPFSKSIKGIENSTNAYYQAYAGIESSMYFVNKERATSTTETGATISGPAGYSYATSSSGNTLPVPGTGNSDFDSTKNYGVLSSTSPLVIEVGGLPSVDWSQVYFYFKVPDTDKNSSTNYGLYGTDTPILNWTLTTPTDTFTASGSYLTQTNISANGSTGWQIYNKSGFSLNGTVGTFYDYYKGLSSFSTLTDKCNDVGKKCTLKISLINSLTLDDIQHTSIPYLEYRVVFPTSATVPLSFTTIKSTGNSYGFRKDLEMKVFGQTSNQAFDFTVFQ